MNDKARKACIIILLIAVLAMLFTSLFAAI